MIIDNKGKLFGKINIVDLAVLLVVIIAIVGVMFTKMKLDDAEIMSDDKGMLIKTSAVLDKLEIVLEVKEVRDVTRDAIIVGDEVYLTSSNELLGTVASVESVPSVREVISSKGEIFKTEVPERYDVKIVVETEGKQKNGGYYTSSNIQLLYGRDMGIKTSTIQTTPVVKNVIATPKSK